MRCGAGGVREGYSAVTRGCLVQKCDLRLVPGFSGASKELGIFRLCFIRGVTGGLPPFVAHFPHYIFQECIMKAECRPPLVALPSVGLHVAHTSTCSPPATPATRREGVGMLVCFTESPPPPAIATELPVRVLTPASSQE